MQTNKTSKNKIFFHCLPPAYTCQPLSSFAALTSFLKNHNYSSQIKYWNILSQTNSHEKSSKFNKKRYLLHGFLPFIKNLSSQYQDKLSAQKIISLAYAENPEIIIRDCEYHENFLQEQLDKISLLIKKELTSVDPSNFLAHGFTTKFNQWIPATFFAENFKNIYPDIPVIVGGFETEKHALSIMRKITAFDFAIWGEGEYPLLELCKVLEKKSDNYSEIPRLIYRNEKLYTSRIKSSPGLDLNAITPNHEDYIQEVKRNKINTDNVFLTIEDSRGCIWNRCKFCSLYTSYKYAVKDNDKIISEIKHLSLSHGINNFIFTGSNLVNSNINKLNSLLDKLIELKDQTNTEFNFIVEIIPKNIFEATIKKLAEASFTVQVGYESISDKILTKLHKSTRFIDLLYFIKNAIKYGLRIEGANILTKIPDEQDEDVLEAIHNLHFLRFFLGKHNFTHNRNPLHINSRTPFIKDIENPAYWTNNKLASIFPADFFSGIDRFEVFDYESSINKNIYLWKEFWKINKFYIKNNFYYKILWKENNNFSYNEFNKGILVKALLFDESKYIDILKSSNEIISFDDLLSELNKKYKRLTAKKLLSLLTVLEQEYLLFMDKTTNKVLSIIDITN